ncbi:hypothetical protein V8B97DRAFT_1500398 [Scleroderma yunnanense]
MSVLVVAKFPSVAAVFMALAASVLLLLVARILFSLMRLWSCPLARSDNPEKLSTFSLFFFPNPRTTPQLWSSPASLPFTLRMTEKMPPPAGSSVSVPSKRSLLVPRWHTRTPGPQFQPPPPALYENPVPLSMAKLIMSRHTFRKPNPNRPRRSSITSPKQSMSPPQTPSRLYHSIA